MGITYPKDGMMNNRKSILLLILWTGRIWAVLSIGFLLVMIFGHLFGDEPQNLNGISDIAALAFFPGGVLLGLVVGLFRPKPGGLISIASLIVFFVLRPDAMTGIWFWILAMPGVLFALHTLIPPPPRFT